MAQIKGFLSFPGKSGGKSQQLAHHLTSLPPYLHLPLLQSFPAAKDLSIVPKLQLAQLDTIRTILDNTLSPGQGSRSFLVLD